MAPNTEIHTVADIVDAFGGPAKFGEICGFTVNPASRGSDMRQRDSINSRHWPKIIAAAQQKSLPITYETLILVHAEVAAAAQAAPHTAEPAAPSRPASRRVRGRHDLLTPKTR